MCSLGRKERILGCLLFGTTAWKSGDRDQWISWLPDIRVRNLGLTRDSTRFLVLP
ncbi:MAG: DUF4338 domain-containing protein [Proteobacteria bacterium]|nr:DUF4338 domain-containing protein [Pseudomonadota bacterium]